MADRRSFISTHFSASGYPPEGNESVKMVIPPDVQLTILGGNDDRMHLKFAHSNKAELRSQLQGSIDANPKSGNFFCFDYVGEDSLKADLLSYRKNYWVESELKQQSDVVIDISRRGDSVDNSFYSKKPHDANSSMMGSPHHFVRPSTDNQGFRATNEVIRFTDPNLVQITSQPSTYRTNEAVERGLVPGATISSITGLRSGLGTSNPRDSLNHIQRTPGAVISISSLEKPPKPSEIRIETYAQDHNRSPGSPQFQNVANPKHSDYQRLFPANNGDSLVHGGSSLASVPATSREQYFTAQQVQPRNIKTSRNPKQPSLLDKDNPGTRSVNLLPRPDSNPKPKTKAQQNQLMKMASFGVEQFDANFSGLSTQRVDFAGEPNTTGPNGTNSKRPFFQNMQNAAKLKETTSIGTIHPQAHIKVKESRKKSTGVDKTNRWEIKTEDDRLYKPKTAKSREPKVAVVPAERTGSKKKIVPPRKQAEPPKRAQSKPKLVSKLSKAVNDEPNPFLLAAYEAIESLKNQLLKQRHDFSASAKPTATLPANGPAPDHNDALVKNLEVLEVELNKIQQQRDSFSPQDELYLTQVFERLSEVKSRLSHDTNHRKDASAGSVLFRGLGQSQAYPFDSRKGSAVALSQVDRHTQDPFEQNEHANNSPGPNQPENVRVTDEIEARLNQPIEHNMVIKTEGDQPRLITMENLETKLFRKKKKKSPSKSPKRAAVAVVPNTVVKVHSPRVGDRPTTDFYTKMMMKEISKKNRLDTMRHKKQKAEMKDCSFQPKITSAGRNKGISW